ncbi:TPA: transposase [Clostridium perfringens]|nr:IS3 family transposase [uncultured Clostridium sp.]HAT4226418.1 transposase [Clostridium perfringens]
MINVRDKFFIIRELSFKYTVKLLCDIAGVSRSGYYKWLNKGNIDISYSELENKILELYNKSKKVYGYRRIKVALLREFGIRVNHKKMLRLMRKINIKSVIRKKKFKYKNLKLNIALLKKIFLIGTLKQKRLMRNGLQILHICFTEMARKKLIYQLLKIYLIMKLLHIRSVNI